MFITDDLDLLIFESAPTYGACIYNPKFEMGIKWNCDKISIKWPKGKKIIRNKDKKNPVLKNIDFKIFNELYKLN